MLLNANCGSQIQQPLEKGDLVLKAREWRREKGMAAARDDLTVALKELDAGHGLMEQRLWHTNADKGFSYPDSLSQLSKAQRQRTGIFFLLGFHTANGQSERVVRHVEAYLQQQGWHAHLVKVPPHRTSREDAMAIQATLSEHLPQLDRAIVIGFSKGGLDWMHWFAEQGHRLPKAEREKIRLMLTFAGVLRGSAVADWLAHAGGPIPSTTRGYIRVFDKHGEEVLTDVRSICVDPWAVTQRPQMRELTPWLRLVSLVAIPEGKGGLTRVHRGFSLLSWLVAMQWRWLGPLDGMTETASQVLPQAAGVPQHIVRVQGSHALLDGHYLNGGTVSKAFLKKNRDSWLGGEELLDDLLRALPSAWVMNRR